jgi:hypothetical protein
MGKQITFNTFCKNTSIRNWHWKVTWRATIAQSLCFYYILIFQFIFTFSQGLWKANMCKTLNFVMCFIWIQMIIPNQVKCNDYSMCIHMKKFQKKKINFESSYLTYSRLHESLQVLIIFFIFVCWQKWFIFLCHSWVYITSQYISYRLYEKYWILSWIENLWVCYIY